VGGLEAAASSILKCTLEYFLKFGLLKVAKYHLSRRLRNSYILKKKR